MCHDLQDHEDFLPCLFFFISATTTLKIYIHSRGEKRRKNKELINVQFGSSKKSITMQFVPVIWNKELINVHSLNYLTNQ